MLKHLKKITFATLTLSSMFSPIVAESHMVKASFLDDLVIAAYYFNPLGWPALHYAIHQNEFHIVQEIAQESPEQLQAYTPLIDNKITYKVSGKKRLILESQVFNELESQGIFDTNWRHGFSTLEVAIQAGSTELTDFLLKAGVDVNSKRSQIVQVSASIKHPTVEIKAEVVTPLVQAILANCPEIVQLLLDNQADTKKVKMVYNFNVTINNARLSSNWDSHFPRQWFSAMELAATLGSDAIIATLIAHNGNGEICPGKIPQSLIDIYKKYHGVDVLLKAIVYNDLPAVEELYAFGERDARAFFEAIANGNPEILQVVVSNEPLTLDEVMTGIQEALNLPDVIEDLFYILYDLEERLQS